MRYLIVQVFMAALIAFLPTQSDAKGCLKGAAVGGVAGHVAGHHAVIGAAAGCAIEHHREKVADKKAAAAARRVPASEPTNGTSVVNTATPPTSAK